MSDPQNEDVSWSLIARAARGDQSARDVFSRSYLPVVRRFLEVRWQATRLADEVDDAVQEVFVECLRENGVLCSADPDKGDLRGFLFGVSRNVAARVEERLLRRGLRDRTAGSTLDTIQSRESTFSMVFDREWARTLMRMAGDRMRAAAADGDAAARQRIELLELRFAKSMPIREIAALWEMDPDAVHRAYGKARGEFRACLRRVVADHAVRNEVDLDADVARVWEHLG